MLGESRSWVLILPVHDYTESNPNRDGDERGCLSGCTLACRIIGAHGGSVDLGEARVMCENRD